MEATPKKKGGLYIYMDFSEIPMKSAFWDEWRARNWHFSGDKSLFLGWHGRAAEQQIKLRF